MSRFDPLRIALRTVLREFGESGVARHRLELMQSMRPARPARNAPPLNPRVREHTAETFSLGGGSRRYVTDNADIGIFRGLGIDPWQVSWSLPEGGSGNLSRVAAGRRAIADVANALSYDVNAYAPSRIAWEVAGTQDLSGRSRLYDYMARRMARTHGYSPTLRTRLNRVLRGQLRRAQGAASDPYSIEMPWWYGRMDVTRDEYVRRGPGRRAIEDALLLTAAAPTAMMLAGGARHEPR